MTLRPDGPSENSSARLHDVVILKATTTDPADVTAMEVLAGAGYEPADVIAVIGKTEGNGGVNDFTRTLGARAWHDALPEGVVTVMSGGTEGVLSPHVSLIVRQGDDSPRSGLGAASAVTPDIPKAELGRRAQVQMVADAVREAMADSGMTVPDVHMVLVKCPLLTSSDVAQCAAAGLTPVATSTYESMAHSREASALGVAVALGELDLADVDSSLAGEADSWSSVASVSSGAELQNCHVLVLGQSSTAGRLRITHAVMSDALDVQAITPLLKEVSDARGRVVQVFAKAEASPDGRIRGYRHTMLTDSDITSTRHARASVGGLLGALFEDPAIYVSGGAEGQGPPGGGPVTVVYELPTS